MAGWGYRNGKVRDRMGKPANDPISHRPGGHRRGAGRIGRFVQPDPENGTVNVGSTGHVPNVRGRLARMKHVRVWLKELGGKDRSPGQHRQGTNPDHSSVPGLVFPHEKTVAAHTAGRKP